MNIVQLQKAFELMSDQELSQQQEHGFLRDQEVKRRVELRNSYQQAQQQADANKTVSEKNMEELMMGGIPSADPMMGEGGDPSMQAGIAGDMAAEGPPMPPMMYGGGMLGFHEGGPVGHTHPHEDMEQFPETRDVLPPSEFEQGVAQLIEEGPTAEEAETLAEIRRIQEQIEETGEDYRGVDEFLRHRRTSGTEGQPRLGHSYMPPVEEWLAEGGTKGGYIELAKKMREAGEDRAGAVERWRASQVEDAEARPELYRDDTQELQKTPTAEELRAFGYYGRGIAHNRQEAVERLMEHPAIFDAIEAMGFDKVEYDKFDLDELRRLIPETDEAAQAAIDEAIETEVKTEVGDDGPQSAEDRVGALTTTDQDTIDYLAGRQQRRADAEAEGRLGLGSVTGLYGKAEQRIQDQLDRETDPGTYAESDKLRSDAANKALTRAKGLKSLSDARIAEQESLLAEELGVSEARIKELRGEMETPESLDKRRRASLFSALGATLMGDPTQLGAGLERTTDKLLTLDEKIALEREKDLDKIAREREKGVERKRLGRGEIYDTTRTGMANWNTAQNAFDSEAHNMQKAREDRDVGAHRQATTAMQNLLMAQAQTVASYLTNAERYNSEIQKMKIQGKNYWTDPTNWDRIDVEINRIRAEASGIRRDGDTEEYPRSEETYQQMIAHANNMERMKTDAVTASGQGVVTSQVDQTVPAVGVVPLGSN